MSPLPRFVIRGLVAPALALCLTLPLTVATGLVQEGALTARAVTGWKAVYGRIESRDWLPAQFDTAKTDLARGEDRLARGVTTVQRLDALRRQVDALSGQIAAHQAQRRVLEQQAAEGDVLAPVAGRVLDVPVAAGAGIMPGEEEPQIALPLVDIHVQAPGLRTDNAMKLVTEPVETIVKAIDGVAHLYSQTRDDSALVTARFLVGTSADAAVLRLHDKLRANMDRVPGGTPEPLVVGRGIDDVAIVARPLTPAPGLSDVTANDLTRISRELRAEIAKTDNVGQTYLVDEAGEAIRIAPDPVKLALYGVTLQQLAGKVAQANRSFNTGKNRA